MLAQLCYASAPHIPNFCGICRAVQVWFTIKMQHTTQKPSRRLRPIYHCRIQSRSIRYSPSSPELLGAHTKAQVRTIVLNYYVDPQAALHALESNDVQVLAPISSQLASTIEKDERFQVQAGDGTDKYVLAFNNRKEPLPTNVRQAIRYAIDEKIHYRLARRNGFSSRWTYS